MEPIKIEEVLKAVNGSLLNSQLRGEPLSTPRRDSLNAQLKGISIDSRTVSSGELFIALKGNKYDGHSFIEEAKQKGAIAAIVQIPNPQSLISIIMVKDTLKALGDLASWYRNLFSIPVIGITGSNGKTTTKELTAKCLSTKYRVLKSEKSFNSLTGVPLALFNLSKNDEVCVLEIGANCPGEIERLAQIAKPKIGVITNVAPTHLENFKTIEGVLKEKLKLLDATEVSILNADDPLLSQSFGRGGSRTAPTTFGIKNGDLRAELLESTNLSRHETGRGGTRFKVQGVLFELPLFGKYQVYNALAAISVGIHSNIELQEMSEALKEAVPAPHREEIINFNGIKIIDSTYNANPVSMRLALEELERYKGRKVAILGDMLELGENASQFHFAIGKTLKEFGVQIIIGVGELARGYVNGNEVDEKFHFESIDLLLKEIENVIKPGDVVLIKGSRAIGMEKIIESLKLKS